MDISRLSPSGGRSLHLVVPGLFGGSGSGAEPQPTSRHPELEGLLARAQVAHDEGRSFEALLFALMGAEVDEQEDLPVAAVTRVLDLGVVDNGWWMRADPIHLAPRRDQLIASDSYALDITQAEAAPLAAEIMETYIADGWTLKAPRPSRWYLKPPRTPRITTTALPEIVGRDIHPYLPRGSEAKAWHTILNEIQILLHTARVNELRERAGKLAVNSLWFWGGGRLPTIKAKGWSSLWSVEPVSLGLARLSEVPSQSLPHSFDEWQRAAAREGSHLVVLDVLRPAALYRDLLHWSQAMQQLEQDWFAPLWRSLKRRELDSVTLLGDAGVSFHVDSSMARRWWKRRKPLASYR
jgi:hypothetical protein